MRAAAVNLECFAFLVLFVVLTVIAWRRFGAPYGLFCAVSLAIPLSVPSHRWPLLSMPRFGLVLFPCFLALAALGGRPRLHTAILVVSSIMLGVAVTQWALGNGSRSAPSPSPGRSLLGATACGERSEPTGRTHASIPVTVQSGDRPLVVAAPAKRIAVFDPVGPGDRRARLGAGSRIVVKPGEPARSPRPAARASRSDRRLGGRGRARPVSGGLATKARIYIAPGDSIRQVERAITQLGLLTGAPVKARTLVGPHRSAPPPGRRPARPCRRRQRVRRRRLPQHHPRPVADRRRAPRGARDECDRTGEAGPVDIPDLLQLDPQVYMATSDTEVSLMDLRAGKLQAATRGQERPVRDRQRGPARARPGDRRRAPARSRACSIRMRFAELDAVTVDGYGTLVRLAIPCPLSRRNCTSAAWIAGADAIRAGFAAEVAYYRPDALLGRDPDTLAALRLECARVFLEGAGCRPRRCVVRGRDSWPRS